MDVDSFTFINLWSSGLMPSKASKLIKNKPFTHFDEVMAYFRKLAFDQHLKDTLSNPNYKGQLQQTINEVFKFDDLVADEFHEEIESFLNVCNNDFKANQLYDQHVADIIEIESSIELDQSKLI